jgi:hypothetical protein
MRDILQQSQNAMCARMNNTDPRGLVFQQKERFGGEENDGTRTGPIMQKRFKRTTGHFYA